MPENLTLRGRVERLMEDALTRTAEAPVLRAFHTSLCQCLERLRQPMRVAIVGLIKAGKSTMMNALLGEAVVPTGVVEATFNVNWLRYGAEPALTVHFKDGRPPEVRGFQDLEDLTRRSDENREFRLGIRYIEVWHPTEMLQTLNLIDTPGLESVYADDSSNTRAFLELYSRRLSDETRIEAAGADAVLYLFSQSVGVSDEATVQEFLGPAASRATPINAIGVLTKTDMYWPSEPEPVEVGLGIARRLSSHPRIRGLFYCVMPACGLLALGAQTLPDADRATLASLAGVPEERLLRLLASAERFSGREYPDIPVPCAARRQVRDRLGQYGVWLACRLLRSGEAGQQGLPGALLDHSGVPALRRLILSHFGNRAYLIKLGRVLSDIRAAWHRERRLEGPERSIGEEIASAFEALEVREHAFHELRVLRSHYEGRVGFDADEVTQLLQVTGEYGASCAARLGLGEAAPLGEMLNAAQDRMQYWYHRASDVMGIDSATADAAQVLARSYERIAYRIHKAEEYLYL